MENIKYYLYQSGKLQGPLDVQQIEQMKTSGKIKQYTWIINNKDNVWEAVEPVPLENPFLMTQAHLENRELSGSFLFMKKPFLGIVQGIHAYGIELLITHDQNQISGIPLGHLLNLNLVDETHEKWINTKMSFQNLEKTKSGTLIRLNWHSRPIQF